MVRFAEASREDAEVIARLRQSIWATTYRGIYPDEMIDRYDYDKYTKSDRARIACEHNHVYLIYRDVTPIGYFSFSHSDGVHVQSLYLLADYRRQGIGAQAFDMVRDYCARIGVKSFTCYCNQHNWSACRFYEEMGGAVVAADIGHLNAEEDQLTFAFDVAFDANDVSATRRGLFQ